MPRGDKSTYTDKQKRKAEHIEEGYEERGVPEDEAERRAWATVNKESGGGNKSGSGRGVRDTKVAARKGGRLGGRAAARRPAAAKSASAKKAAATRKRRKS
ncbi:MAG: plasmid stabilization protein [Rhodospirillales bacterium]|jgi:plasmid stabilization system protein ParE|nr:plasmid stabilization protein [Rhodospirillales bacterium]